MVKRIELLTIFGPEATLGCWQRIWKLQWKFSQKIRVLPSLILCQTCYFGSLNHTAVLSRATVKVVGNEECHRLFKGFLFLLNVCPLFNTIIIRWHH